MIAPSRFLVRKSQKILGQKKQWNPAAIWSMVVKLVTMMVVWGMQCTGIGLTGSSGEDDETRPVVLD